MGVAASSALRSHDKRLSLRWRLPLTQPYTTKHLPFKSRSATTRASGLLGCLLLAHTLRKATVPNAARQESRTSCTEQATFVS